MPGFFLHHNNVPQQTVMHLSWKSPFTLAVELSRVALVRLAGKPAMVEQATFITRIATCESCPFFSDRQCTKCTCFMDVKAWLSTSRCPVGRWRAVVGVPWLPGLRWALFRIALLLQALPRL